MKDAIVTKLGEHLATSIDTECKAVYLLCQVRKLLEKQPFDSDRFSLRMFCHWALHVDLSNPSTTMRFMEKVDGYIYDKLSRNETLETLSAEAAVFQEFGNLETFRTQLLQLLQEHSLSTSLCDDPARWSIFLHAYASVIEDGSLTCESRSSSSRTAEDRLKILKKITFTKSIQNVKTDHLGFSMNWNILLKDERTIEFDVSALNHNLKHWSIRIADGTD